VTSVDDAVADERKVRIDALRGLDEQELRRLPSESVEVAVVVEAKVTFTTVIDPYPDGRCLVAVRSDRPRALGAVRAGATDAFWLLLDGTKRDASIKDILDHWG
jgi:hypothetical protein